MVPLHLRRWRKQSAWGIAQFRGFQLYGSASSSLHRHGSLRIPLSQTHLFFSCFMFFPIRLSIGRRLQRLPRHRSPVPFFVGRTDSDPTSFWKALWLGEGVPVGGWGHGRNSPRWDKDCLIMFNPHPWPWISITRDYMDCYSSWLMAHDFNKCPSCPSLKCTVSHDSIVTDSGWSWQLLYWFLIW